jgi:excisionase family DNA binding protein
MSDQLTLDDVAELTGLSRSTVRRRVLSGEIAASKVLNTQGKEKWVITKADATNYAFFVNPEAVVVADPVLTFSNAVQVKAATRRSKNPFKLFKRKKALL